MLLGKWHWERQVSWWAGRQGTSRGKCVRMMSLTRTSSGGNSHCLDYRHVCCHLEGHTNWVTKAVPYPHTKIQMNCSCKLLSLWLLLKRWSMLSLWLLSPSTSLTLENKRLSVLTVIPRQPPHCPASIHTPLSSCSNLCCLPQNHGGSTESFQVQWVLWCFLAGKGQSPMAASVPNRGTSPEAPSSCHLKGKLWKMLHPEATALSHSPEPFVPFFVPVTGGIHMRRATLFYKGELQVWKPGVLKR